MSSSTGTTAPIDPARIVIPPYSDEQKRGNPLVRWLAVVAGYLTENGLLTMILLVISCGLLTAAVMSHVYGPPVFAWLYVPVYTVCGPFVAWVLLSVMNMFTKPLREDIRRMKRRGDTSEFDDSTYQRVLSDLRKIGVPKARRVLHENRDSAEAYTRVYSIAVVAAWDRGMKNPEAKHYAHHLAMLTYPGIAESARASQLIAMIEDRGLVTDSALITEILTTEVPSLNSGQL